MRRARVSQSPAATKASVAPTSNPSKPPSSKRLRSAGRTAGEVASAPSNTNTSQTMIGERFNQTTGDNTAPNPFPLPQYKPTTTILPPATTSTSQHMEENDRSSVSDSDSVHSPHERNEAADNKPKPAPGKKTRGRVKIEMQYIQNKLRRYTTFSKRKSGIMKKAYELSTLTGTQVMLLVASETGHVYTFATPKLQPMITSETGKALIQTCLHTPDPHVTPSEYDIRMSAAGYEETDLGYSMNEEDSFKSSLDPSQLVSSGMTQLVNSHSVILPPGMVQMPFTAPVSMPEHSMGGIMGQPQHMPAYSMPVTSSPHGHSSPPSYSPTHSASPQRTFPGSPPTVPYTQSMPPQPIMMDDLGTSGSPMRKSPESHYLHHNFDRSPSNSPMANSYFPVRTHSPSHAGLYSGGSPPGSSHSPVGHY